MIASVRDICGENYVSLSAAIRVGPCEPLTTDSNPTEAPICYKVLVWVRGHICSAHRAVRRHPHTPHTHTHTCAWEALGKTLSTRRASRLCSRPRPVVCVLLSAVRTTGHTTGTAQCAVSCSDFRVPCVCSGWMLMLDRSSSPLSQAGRHGSPSLSRDCQSRARGRRRSRLSQQGGALWPTRCGVWAGPREEECVAAGLAVALPLGL